jgi:hypothetical protein
MSIALSGSLVITGSIFATQGITGSFSGSATSASYADTLGGLPSSSFAPAATFNTVSQSFATTSGSIAGRMTIVEGQDATTGSNTFTGPQYVSQASNAISFTSTASLYTDGGLRVAKDSFVSGTAYFNNITVYGTSSIEYITSSQVNIGSNVITVNTDTPAIRFGGISVFDSGSTQLTGSLFWDSEKNHWIYSNPSGSSYNSAMLMNGPRNTGSLGDEQGTTNNALMKGQGGDHITSSQMIDDGTTVRIPGTLQVTGSTILASALTGTSATFSDSSTLLTLSSGAGTKAVFATTRNFGVNRNFQIAVDEFAESAFTITPSTTLGGSSYTTPIFTLAAAGAATFSSSVTAATLIFKDAINSNSYGFRGLSGIVTLDAGSVYPTGWNFQYGGTGSSALYINGSGNVGIGTSSPNSTLQVSKSGATFQVTDTAKTANNTFSVYGLSQTSWAIATGNSGSFSGGEKITLHDNGNVGIGTATDYSSKLTIIPSSNPTSSTGANNQISIGEVSNNTGYCLKLGYIYTGGGYQGSIQSIAGSAGSTLFLNASGGNVIIGSTTDSNQKLTVNGSYVRMHSLSTDNTNAGVYYEVKSGASTVGQSSQLVDNAGNYIITTGTSSEAERFRITAAGFLKAKGGAPAYVSLANSSHEISTDTNSNYTLFCSSQATTPYGLYLWYANASPNNSTNEFLACADTTNAKAYIFSNGNLANRNGTYGTISSDIRLKENIVPATSKLEDLLKLNVINFNLKDDGDKKKQLGFIAQEFKEVFPSLVYERDTRKYDEDGNLLSGLEDSLGVQVGMEFAILVKAIQELKAELDQAKAEIEILKNK